MYEIVWRICGREFMESAFCAGCRALGYYPNAIRTFYNNTALNIFSGCSNARTSHLLNQGAPRDDYSQIRPLLLSLSEYQTLFISTLA